MKLNDFAEMIENCSAEAMAYSWMLDMLFTTDTIVGDSPISRRERDAAKKSKGKYLTESRVTIYEQFESGERSYRSTSMGGCSQIEVCMERAHGSITACLPCPSSHIKLKKLDRAISNQGVFVKKLVVGSVERVVAERELNDLLSYREKWSDK